MANRRHRRSRLWRAWKWRKKIHGGKIQSHSKRHRVFLLQSKLPNLKTVEIKMTRAHFAILTNRSDLFIPTINNEQRPTWIHSNASRWVEQSVTSSSILISLCVTTKRSKTKGNGQTARIAWCKLTTDPASWILAGQYFTSDFRFLCWFQCLGSQRRSTVNTQESCWVWIQVTQVRRRDQTHFRGWTVDADVCFFLAAIFTLG